MGVVGLHATPTDGKLYLCVTDSGADRVTKVGGRPTTGKPMQKDQEAFGDIQFLTGSPQRPNVLAALRASPARPSELCERIDATRTTIQRILAGLRDRQWVVKHEGDYRLTVTGKRIHEQYRALLAETRRARDVGPLARHLEPLPEEIPTALLEDGELTVGEAGSPLAPLSRFTEWFEAVDADFYAVSPVVAQPFNEVATTLLQSGVDIELVIDQKVLEQSQQQYTAELELGINHDQIDIYVHDSPLSVGVAVEAGRCCLVAYDADNNIRAVLEGTDPEAYDWAKRVYEQRRTNAEPLEAIYEG